MKQALLLDINSLEESVNKRFGNRTLTRKEYKMFYSLHRLDQRETDEDSEERYGLHFACFHYMQCMGASVVSLKLRQKLCGMKERVRK